MNGQLNTGIRGATRQSWIANPRELLRDILESNPAADRQAIFRLFSQELDQAADHDDYIAAIIEYWFANNYYSLIGNQPPPVRGKASARVQIVEQTASEIKQNVKAKIKERAKILLLEMTLPNGKQLRDCTGAECADMSPRIGGWLGEVARRVKPDQRVGDVLSEKQLKAIY